MKTYSHTITNSRDNLNKDRFLIKENEKWFTIADGVSSKGEAGAKAAQISIDKVKNTKVSSLSNKSSIKKFLADCGESIKKIGGATTFTSIFLKDEKAILFHTGDSECYFVYSNWEIKEWTIPTTTAYGLYLAKRLPKENIKNTPYCSNVLIECLGKDCNPQITEILLNNVQAIVLCTDGVNKISPETIVNILQNVKSNDDPAKIICEKALEAKSDDDITCVVIKF